MSMYRITARIGDCTYNEVCWADEESMAHQIARSMFGSAGHAEYFGEQA